MDISILASLTLGLFIGKKTPQIAALLLNRLTLSHQNPIFLTPLEKMTLILVFCKGLWGPDGIK